MGNMGIWIKLTSAGLVAAFVLVGAGCSKKLSSETESTSLASAAQSVDPLSFSVLDAKTREYTFGLNEFMRTHGSEVKQHSTHGETLGGVPANCSYTVSLDGKYEVLQMEKDLGGGMQVDEYFNLGDALFITRSTMHDDGKFDPVDKYYITEGMLYKLDSTAKTVTQIVNINDPSAEEAKANIDIYFSFEEIREIYA